MEPSRQILIATGITGGHFYPAVAFADAYLAAHPGSEITVLLPRKETTFSLDSYRNRFKFEVIAISPLPRLFSFQLFLFPLKLLTSLRQTLCLMRLSRASVLVSFGSYGSVPAVLAAWLLRIPIVAHEQNRIFGWANFVSGFFADAVAVSFPKTIGWVAKRKIHHVGYPIRQKILNASHGAKHHDVSDLLRILILGGSQGAHAINRLFFDFLLELTSTEKKKIAVIHITGQKDFDWVSLRYQDFNVQHETFAFCNEIEKLFCEADCVIGRAGAGTIFEMAAFGIPGILIPYPHAYSHQSKNAGYVKQLGGVQVSLENDLSGTRLKEIIFSKFDRLDEYQEMARNIQKLHVPDADKKMVVVVDEYLNRP